MKTKFCLINPRIHDENTGYLDAVKCIAQLFLPDSYGSGRRK